jgi:hypothetical protein
MKKKESKVSTGKKIHLEILIEALEVLFDMEEKTQPGGSIVVGLLKEFRKGSAVVRYKASDGNLFDTPEERNKHEATYRRES